MIVTLTLNPAVDQNAVVDRLVAGDTNRVRETRLDPGGKGINVSRVLRELGQRSLALGFVSGSLGRFIESTLTDLGILHDFIHTEGQTRTNVTIIDNGTHQRTTLSGRGPETDVSHMEELYERMDRYLRPGDWLVLGGSIPPPLSSSVYRDIITFAKARKVNTVLDADGEALTLGVEARPFIVKPNRRELQRLLSREVGTGEDVVGLCCDLHELGIPVAVVTMSEEGAVASANDGCWWAYPPTVEVLSAVGAGDAMAAGLVAALSEGKSVQEGLRLGTAAGAATAMTPGTQLCRGEDVRELLPRVKIEEREPPCQPVDEIFVPSAGI